jgi:hypothetical protein
MTWIDPDFTKTAVSTPQEAKERITKDQNARIAGMVSGVVPNYQIQADAPNIRMEALQAWEQVPGNQQKFQMDATLQKLHEAESNWIQFAISQQIDNPQTGRTGVDTNKVNAQLQEPA